MTIAVMVGFVTGFFIPTWYRANVLRSEKRRREPILETHDLGRTDVAE